MKRLINMGEWNRKEHFHFFSAFDDPFFGITTLVDFTDIYIKSKENNRSFFLSSVHFLLKCVNDTDAFKLRIENKQVVQYDTIHLSATISREDGTFGFGYFEYNADIDPFIQKSEEEISRVRNSTGLSLNEDTSRADLIHYSALPWFVFSEMKHAGSFKNGDSVPRISTGKLTKEVDRFLLPVSISVHHGLMDGRDVAELLERLSCKSER